VQPFTTDFSSDNIKYPTGSDGPFLTQLAHFLIQIDKKLDYLIEKLEVEDQTQERFEVISTKDISGSGLNMIIAGPVEIGQVLQVAVQLPNFPFNMVYALGKIIRLASVEDERENLSEVGINFVEIGEEDREKLISYSFTEQRRAIRNSKDDIETT